MADGNAGLNGVTRLAGPPARSFTPANPEEQSADREPGHGPADGGRRSYAGTGGGSARFPDAAGAQPGLVHEGA